MSKHISQNFHQQTRRPSSTFLEPATPSKNWGLRRRVLEHRTFGDGRRVRRQTQYGDEAERDMLRRGWDGRRSSLSDEKDGDEEEFDIGNEAVTKKGRVVEQTSSSLTAMGGLLRRVKKRVANLRKNAEDDHETNPEEINDDEDEEWHAPDVKEARVEIEALSENWEECEAEDAGENVETLPLSKDGLGFEAVLYERPDVEMKRRKREAEWNAL